MEDPPEDTSRCPRCGELTRTIVGLCPNCGGVKVPGTIPAAERYRPGLLFDSDDFDPVGWLFSFSLGGALLSVAVLGGIALLVVLLI